MNFAMLLAGGNTEGGGGSTWTLILMVAVIAVAIYFLMWRPQKKKEKQAADMRNSLEIGDEITTIGGIVGRVVNLKEDTFVIETAGDRSRMRFKRWAIQEVSKLSLEGDSTEPGIKPTKTETSETGAADADTEKKKPFWRR